MRLTTRTTLAFRTLAICALNPGRVIRKQEIATASCASENHLAQVINALAQFGYVTTRRGRNGGLTLARDPREIRVGEVFRAFEGAVPFTDCLDPGAAPCPLQGCCALRAALAAAVEAFYATLDRLSLADMVIDNRGLAEVLDFGQRIVPLGTPCTSMAGRTAPM